MEWWERITSLNLLFTLLLMQPKIPLAFWARSTYLLLEVFLLTAVFNAALNLLSDAELLIAEVRISQRAAL